MTASNPSRAQRCFRFVLLVIFISTTRMVGAQPDTPPPANQKSWQVKLTSIAKKHLDYLPETLAFAPDGTRLAAGGNTVVSMFETEGLQTKGVYTFEDGNICSLLFSKDGRQLFIGCSASDTGRPSYLACLQWPATELSVRQSEFPTFKSMTFEGALCRSSRNQIVLTNVALKSDSVIVSYDDSVTITDQFVSRAGERVWSIRRDLTDRVFSINRFDPNSQRFQERKLDLTVTASDFAFNYIYPCGNHAVICWHSQQKGKPDETVVEVWGGDDFRRMARCDIPKTTMFAGGTSLADGRLFCAVGTTKQDIYDGKDEGFLTLIDTMTGRVVFGCEVEKKVSSVAFTSEGNYLAVGKGWQADGYEVELWKLECDVPDVPPTDRLPK